MTPHAHKETPGLKLPRKKPPSLGFVSLAKTWLRSISDFLQNLAFNPAYFTSVSILFLLAEIVVSIGIIHRVKYTEIDWNAYMQQVQGFVLNGSLDYQTLRGDTGPLVYPAGHLYIYTVFYYVTDFGTNIRRAQYIFAAIYIFLVFTVARIYAKCHFIPPYCLIFLCLTAYRIHSICMLRLFNDPIAMLFLYISMWLMLNGKWSRACIFFSIAVSVKMNILLFAPGLLILLIASNGYKRTAMHVATCAVVQLIIGAPFLLSNPIGYISGAFNLGRIFFFEWTVNWRFLPENIFVDRRLHVGLLVGHIAVLVAFALSTWLRQKGGLKTILSQWDPKISLESREIVLILFTSNFIGVIFSRSLHYQFYVWYFHTLPFMLWSISSWSFVMRLSIVGLIELSWNTYPSTNWSSLSLHICHFLILHGLWKQCTKQRAIVKKLQ